MNSPETYYGHYVTNYNSPNDAGINAQNEQKWQIFMADDTNIYLITNNYITKQYTGMKNEVGFDYNANSQTPETATQMWFTSILGQYNANTTTTDIPQILSKLDKQSIYHKWINIPSNQTKNYNNEKAVASMLDVDVWDGYNNSIYSKYAIGGPTLEMFCKAYNETRVDGTDLLYANENNTTGYLIQKGNENPVNRLTDLKKGAKNSTVNLDNCYFKSSTECVYYWLASPSSSNNTLCIVHTNGVMTWSNTSGYSKLGFRPLVCLKSNVHLVKNGDGETYSLELD